MPTMTTRRQGTKETAVRAQQLVTRSLSLPAINVSPLARRAPTTASSAIEAAHPRPLSPSLSFSPSPPSEAQIQIQLESSSQRSSYPSTSSTKVNGTPTIIVDDGDCGSSSHRVTPSSSSSSSTSISASHVKPSVASFAAQNVLDKVRRIAKTVLNNEKSYGSAIVTKQSTGLASTSSSSSSLSTAAATVTNTPAMTMTSSSTRSANTSFSLSSSFPSPLSHVNSESMMSRTRPRSTGAIPISGNGRNEMSPRPPTPDIMFGNKRTNGRQINQTGTSSGTMHNHSQRSSTMDSSPLPVRRMLQEVSEVDEDVFNSEASPGGVQKSQDTSAAITKIIPLDTQVNSEGPRTATKGLAPTSPLAPFAPLPPISCKSASKTDCFLPSSTTSSANGFSSAASTMDSAFSSTASASNSTSLSSTSRTSSSNPFASSNGRKSVSFCSQVEINEEIQNGLHMRRVAHLSGGDSSDDYDSLEDWANNAAASVPSISSRPLTPPPSLECEQNLGKNRLTSSDSSIGRDDRANDCNRHHLIIRSDSDFSLAAKSKSLFAPGSSHYVSYGSMPNLSLTSTSTSIANVTENNTVPCTISENTSSSLANRDAVITSSQSQDCLEQRCVALLPADDNTNTTSLTSCDRTPLEWQVRKKLASQGLARLVQRSVHANNASATATTTIGAIATTISNIIVKSASDASTAIPASAAFNKTGTSSSMSIIQGSPLPPSSCALTTGDEVPAADVIASSSSSLTSTPASSSPPSTPSLLAPSLTSGTRQLPAHHSPTMVHSPSSLRRSVSTTSISPSSASRARGHRRTPSVSSFPFICQSDPKITHAPATALTTVPTLIKSGNRTSAGPHQATTSIPIALESGASAAFLRSDAAAGYTSSGSSTPLSRSPLFPRRQANQPCTPATTDATALADHNSSYSPCSTTRTHSQESSAVSSPLLARRIHSQVSNVQRLTGAAGDRLTINDRILPSNDEEQTQICLRSAVVGRGSPNQAMVAAQLLYGTKGFARNISEASSTISSGDGGFLSDDDDKESSAFGSIGRLSPPFISPITSEVNLGETE